VKRLGIFFGGITLLLAVLFGTRLWIQQAQATSSSEEAAGDTKQTLTIFNWGEYIDPELIAKFEQESGYHVIYSTFDSNEGMETKIKQGGTSYDLVFPSESIIPRMLENELLIPLDHQKIEGMEQLSSFLMNQSFDPNNQYSLPYFWGTLGLMVNTEQVDVKDVQRWDDLWHPRFKNKLLVIDGSRETMGISMQSMGISLNEKNREKVEATIEKLDTLRPNVQAVLTDEIKTLMIQGDAPIGLGYSGDAAYVMAENPAIKYVVPEDGGVIWTDNFAIPRTVKNLDGAYAFINFMLRTENAKQNAEYVGYATPHEGAKALLPKELTEDEVFYPSETALAQMEHYEYLGQETLELYNDLFLEWKMGL